MYEEEKKLIETLQSYAEQVRNSVVEEKRKEEYLNKTKVYARVLREVVIQLGASGGKEVIVEEGGARYFKVGTENVSTTITIKMEELLEFAAQVSTLHYTPMANSTKKVLFGFVEKTE